MNRFLKQSVFILWLGFSPIHGNANTFVVTSTKDAGPGSFRQAIEEANNLPGVDTIQFQIPGSGIQTILLQTALPDIINSVVVDGYSQPGSKTNSLPNGNDALILIRLDGRDLTNGAFASGLTLACDNNIVRGLTIIRFHTGIKIDSGSGNVVAGNWIGVDADGISRGNTGDGIAITCPVFGHATNNIIGGTKPEDRNVISGNNMGITISPTTAQANIIQGNFIGTDQSGTLPRGNLFDGIHIQGAPRCVIGGAATNAGNVISANGNGVYLLSAAETRVQGNTVGADVSRFYDLGNTQDGIGLQGSSRVLIGGSEPALGNLVGNNRGYGVSLLGADNNQILGNIIGTDPGLSRPLGNLKAGVWLMGSSSNRIGGVEAAAANVIFNNGQAGIGILTGERNAISGNRIFNNEGLGIDLGEDGVTANDAGDMDIGANQLQNYPVITEVVAGSQNTRIKGVLNSKPNQTYRLEFFASTPWDSTGNGEGQSFLGFSNVATDTDGNASVEVEFPVALVTGQVVAATATDSLNNTSEFSARQEVAVSPLRLIRQPGNLLLSWSGQDQLTLFYTDRLLPPQWQPLTNGIITEGVVKSLPLTLPQGQAARFYRLMERQ